MAMYNNKGKDRKLQKSEYKQAIEARRTIVSELYEKGYTYRQIKESVIKRLDLDSYSLKTVKDDIDAILEEWKSERINNVDVQKTRELATLDALLREAWEAWEKSKTDYKSKTTHIRGSFIEGGGANDRELKGFSQADKEGKALGNPKYLEVIIKILERKAKILGYETIPIELNGTLHNVNDNFDYSALPTDVLLDIAYKLQDAEFNKINDGK